MEEQEVKKSQGKSVAKILFVILGMLAFGGLGFYFGIQDTFHVSDKIGKEKKEEPKIEIKTEEEKYVLDNTKLYKGEYKDMEKLASMFYMLAYNNTDEITDDEKINIAFLATLDEGKQEVNKLEGYSEEELFELGYASDDEYIVSVLDVQNNLKKYFETYNAEYVPNELYINLTKYDLVYDKYIGHLMITGIVDGPPYEYTFVSNVENNGSQTEITVSKVYSDGNVYMLDEEGTKTYKNEEEVLKNSNELEHFVLTFDFTKTEGQFISITK